MNILGIETSCDETSAAVLIIDGFEIKVAAQIINSQQKIHANYGGIVPEVAARRHIENILPVVRGALDKAGLELNELDAVAVTQGPGLIGSLLVGVETAKTISYLAKKQLVPVNHLIGHLWSWLLPEVEKTATISVSYPWLCLVVSGGHTELVLVKDANRLELLGKTSDDAAGEAFDKVAKMLGLGYPGGPAISAAARSGNDQRFNLPRPLLKDPGYRFSFAGLKTSVLYQDRKQKNKDITYQADMAASFEKAVIDVLVTKVKRAMADFKVNRVAVVGGVSANKRLRQELQMQLRIAGGELYLPKLVYTGDNAAMIALAGYFQLPFSQDQKQVKSLTAVPNLSLMDE